VLTVSVGEPLIRIFELAYPAREPLLLVGPAGIGKSAIVAEAARRLRIQHLALDVSVLEPVDLSGLPRFTDDGRTAFAPPAFLPNSGDGLLLLEELNRAERAVRVPTLQLLSARRINSYELPEAWLPIAAVNPSDAGYEVDELDLAFMSRFCVIRVVADVDEWVQWATSAKIDPRVISFVEQSPDIFLSPEANPRGWESVSRLLTAYRGTSDDDALAALIVGKVGEQWGAGFLAAISGAERPLSAVQVLEEYRAYRAVARGWPARGRLDLVVSTIEQLKRRLQRQANCDQVIGDPKQRQHLQDFRDDMPADLRIEFDEWLEERGYADLLPNKAPRKKRA
jgi:MoxR-like ATPase